MAPAKRGRPRRDPSAVLAVSVHIRVTRAEAEALRRVAAENRSRVVDVIREAVNEFVADYREGPAIFV